MSERELRTARTDLDLIRSSLSHDVQSSLRMVEGCIAAALEDYPDQIGRDARDCLDRAVVTVHTMKTKVEALLDFYRCASVPLARAEIDVTGMAREAFDELTANQPQRAELVVAPGMRIDADPALLRSLLQCLIGNALKFSAGKDAAVVEVGEYGVDGARRIFVRDHGVGFDARYASKLFQPFGRLHSPREFTGIGMSLAIVRRIVERHGGEVGAESTPGEGATFWFTLP